MTFQEVKDLHDLIQKEYDSFVTSAREEGGDIWQDTFLTENVPITISVRYGQNQSICQRGSIDEEEEHWDRIHRYDGIRSMSMALATHIKWVHRVCHTKVVLTIHRSVPVSQWEEFPVDDLKDRHEYIYDSPFSNDRNEIDLENHPLLDEAGLEVPVYDDDGYRIPRRNALVDEGVSDTGMLFKLKDLHELFHHNDEDIDIEEDTDQPVTPHYLYPMACLKDVGQFQAHGLFTCFRPHLNRINQALLRWDNANEEMGDEDEIESTLFRGSRPLIRGIASQGYNMAVHRTRGEGRYHDAQMGMMTSAFIGSHVRTAMHKHKAKVFRRRCEDSLPFDRYHDKITDSHFDQSLRVENVYTIDIYRLASQQRTGRYVIYYVRIPD